ncbi:MAG: sugar phosphate isomerase/epimerase [Bacteroidales bacterium]|jgi:sugar phosphate isomerase/epimerase|nr:sugar phosphate isomerase/epimerase [Bacteroidales bacterium]
MQYNRRDFIQRTAAALSTLAISGIPMSCGGNRGRIFKYALCNEIVQEFSWPEQCEIIGSAGYDGVEVASFTLVKEGVQEITGDTRKQMVKDMKNAGIVCAGLHWLFTPPPHGLHFTTSNKELRQKSINYLDQLIDFCGDLGGEVMVFGSPGQRGTTGGVTVREATDYFADGLAQVADHAKDRKVTILIESLPLSSTDVVNTLEEAVEIVNKIGHPSISSMFDFHNTLDETEPWTDLIKKYYDNIKHIHVQNMDGTLIRTDAIPGDFIPVFQTLRDLNYKKWVSLEVFDFSPGGKFIAEESMKTFLEIEKRL